MSVTIGQVTAMTVITPIIEGRLEALQTVLTQIHTTPDSPLRQVNTIHFARWVIINEGKQLLFTTNFDGGWEQYLKDFAEKTPGGVDAIWSNCVGYPGVKNLPALIKYVRQYEVNATLFYAAYPDTTVRQVQKALRVQDKFQALLDEFN